MVKPLGLVNSAQANSITVPKMCNKLSLSHKQNIRKLLCILALLILASIIAVGETKKVDATAAPIFTSVWCKLPSKMQVLYEPDENGVLWEWALENNASGSLFKPQLQSAVQPILLDREASKWSDLRANCAQPSLTELLNSKLSIRREFKD